MVGGRHGASLRQPFGSPPSGGGGRGARPSPRAAARRIGWPGAAWARQGLRPPARPHPTPRSSVVPHPASSLHPAPAGVAGAQRCFWAFLGVSGRVWRERSEVMRDVRCALTWALAAAAALRCRQPTDTARCAAVVGQRQLSLGCPPPPLPAAAASGSGSSSPPTTGSRDSSPRQCSAIEWAKPVLSSWSGAQARCARAPSQAAT
jgi:hypothetical protein